MGEKKLLFRLAATMEARRSQNDDFQSSKRKPLSI